MPKYPYECVECGEFDATRRMSERDEAVECPTCGSFCQRVFSVSTEFIIPARWRHDKAGIREVTGGHSMHDIRHNGELRRKHLV